VDPKVDQSSHVVWAVVVTDVGFHAAAGDR